MQSAGVAGKNLRRKLVPMQAGEGLRGGQMQETIAEPHPAVPGEFLIYFSCFAAYGGSFGIYDTAAEQVRYFDLEPGDTELNRIARGPDGTFWSGSAAGRLYSYSPAQDAFRSHGFPFATAARNGLKILRSCAVNADGVVYYGDIQGNFGRYFPRAERFEYLGRPFPDTNYLAYLAPGPGGAIFAAGLFNTGIYRYHPASGTAEMILPADPYRRNSEDYRAGAIQVSGEYLFAKVGPHLVFDARTGKFLCEIPPIEPPEDVTAQGAWMMGAWIGTAGGCAYFVTKRGVACFDPRTRELALVEITEEFLSRHPRLAAGLRWGMTPQFHLLRFSHDRRRLERVQMIECRNRGMNIALTGVGPDGAIHVASLQSQLISRADHRRRELRALGYAALTEGQPSSIFGYAGRLYIGSYPGGRLLCYDPAQKWRVSPGQTDSNPRVLSTRTKGLYRPFAHCVDAEGCLWWGGIEDWGATGGGLIRFSPDNRVLEHHRLPQHQVWSLACAGPGLLAFTTHRQVCLWSIAEQKVVRMLDYPARGIFAAGPGRLFAFDVIHRPDLGVWTSSPKLFSLPDLRELRSYQFPVDDATDGVLGLNGLFYGIGHGPRCGIFALNLESGRSRVICEVSGRLLTEDGAGNLWFVRSLPLGHPQRGREQHLWLLRGGAAAMAD